MIHRSERRAVQALIVLGVAWLFVLGAGAGTAAFAAPGGEAFTVIVLPDTQIYSQNYPEIFLAQTEWIAAMADQLNIRLVIHEGDIVNQGARSMAQWDNAKAAMDVLDRAGIPTVIAIGNHDYDDEAVTRNSDTFNAYFGLSRYEGRPWFGGAFEEGKADNVYALIEAGGTELLIIALEFGPRRAAVDWANDVIARHPDRQVIAVTHSYMYFDDTRMGPGDHWNPKAYGVGSDALDGEDLWHELFSRHENVRMVLSGHVLESGVGRRIDVGAGGAVVHQMLANYQMMTMGGQGYLRILEFQPEERRVRVSTYSPYLDRYMTNPDHNFDLDSQSMLQPEDLVTVEVRAIDRVTNGLVSGARVRVSDEEGRFFGAEVTGENGSFRRKLPVGSYRFATEHAAYRPAELSWAGSGPGDDALDLVLTPLPFANIAVGGIRPGQHMWTGWFSEPVLDVDLTIGPADAIRNVQVDLNIVQEGRVWPLVDLYRGEEPPGLLGLDVHALDEGTYEILVRLEDIDGQTTSASARFGLRRWETVVDALQPPSVTWFGVHSRLEAAEVSDGWIHLTDAPEDFFGDKDRMTTGETGAEWLVWEIPRIHDVQVTAYVDGPGAVTDWLTIEASADGAAWTPLVPEVTEEVGPSGRRRAVLWAEAPPEMGFGSIRLTLAPQRGDTDVQIGEVILRSPLHPADP